MLTMAATIGAMRLPNLPGMKYHDANPLGWVPFFGIPIVTIITVSKIGGNWKRYAAVLFITFAVAFLLAWIAFTILAQFR